MEWKGKAEKSPSSSFSLQALPPSSCSFGGRHRPRALPPRSQENNWGALTASPAALCPSQVRAWRGTHGDAFLTNVLKAPAAWYNFIHTKDKTFFSPEVLLRAPRTSYPWQERFSAAQRRGQSPARARKSIQTSFHFRSIIIFPKAPAAQCSLKSPNQDRNKAPQSSILALRTTWRALHADQGMRQVRCGDF